MYIQIIVFMILSLIFYSIWYAQAQIKKQIAVKNDELQQKEAQTKRVFLFEDTLIHHNLDCWSLYAKLERGQDVQEVERFLANPQMFFPPHILEELPEYLSMPLSEGNTLLHVSAIKGYQRVTEMLCGLGVNVMHANYQGNTALHCAAFSGNGSIVTYLYQKMPLVSVKNSDGLSARQLALRFKKA